MDLWGTPHTASWHLLFDIQHWSVTEAHSADELLLLQGQQPTLKWIAASFFFLMHKGKCIWFCYLWNCSCFIYKIICTTSTNFKLSWFSISCLNLSDKISLRLLRISGSGILIISHSYSHKQWTYFDWVRQRYCKSCRRTTEFDKRDSGRSGQSRPGPITGSPTWSCRDS